VPIVGRVLGIAVARVARRYPIVAVAYAAWRWWQRRSAGSERTVVRLRRGETITVTDQTTRGI
jgi:hypothetical protein